MHRCWLYQSMYRLWVIVYQCKINTRKIAKARKQFFIRNNSSTQSPSRFHISGKTTILYQLKRNDPVTTIPACGFSVETASPCSRGGLNFTVTVWDIGGQEKSRQLWKYCYKNTEGKPWPISIILSGLSTWDLFHVWIVPAIQIQCKIVIVVFQLLVNRSQHCFAHATTAQAPWYVHFCTIPLLELGLEQNEFAIEFKLRWNNR